MDLVTQGLLGAAIGQAFFTKRLGRQAVTVGALAGLLPDADVLVKYFSNDPMADLKYHRWITHSFWFGLVLSPPIAYYLAKTRPVYTTILNFKQRFQSWFWLLFWALFTHPVLDLFTTFGTQFYAPFSNYRIHWNAVAIIDFGYSLTLVAALIAGWRHDRKGHWHRGQHWAQIALVVTTAYLGGGYAIDRYTVDYASQVMPGYTIKAHPTLAQPFYRKVYAYHTHEVCAGYYTPFKPHYLHFQCRNRQYDAGIQALLSSSMGQTFLWLTDDELWPERDINDLTLVRVHDLRFTHPQSAFQGAWGIAAHVSTDGTLLDEPRRYSTGYPTLSCVWHYVIRPAFGLQP